MKYRLTPIKVIGIIFLFILMGFMIYPFLPHKIKRIINKMEVKLFSLFTKTEDPFQTPQEHKEKFGIENVNLSFEEKEKLHSMIEEAFRKALPSHVKVLKIEFSQPRRYRDLKDRIGIITYISLTDPPNFLGGYPRYIFIFKRVNGRWEIEKKWEIMLRLDVDEAALIQSYFTD